MSERETKRNRVSLEQPYNEEKQRVRRSREEYLEWMRRLAEERRELYVVEGLMCYLEEYGGPP
jgi:hypothetical protein